MRHERECKSLRKETHVALAMVYEILELEHITTTEMNVACGKITVHRLKLSGNGSLDVSIYTAAYSLLSKQSFPDQL